MRLMAGQSQPHCTSLAFLMMPREVKPYAHSGFAASPYLCFLPRASELASPIGIRKSRCLLCVHCEPIHRLPQFTVTSAPLRVTAPPQFTVTSAPLRVTAPPQFTVTSAPLRVTAPP